ncbi:MAG: glycosyltransferase family 2 protein [Planctomycetota bacterium]
MARGSGSSAALAPPSPLPPDFLLSVLVPTYNEKGTIREILGRVREAPFRKEILVVDDASTDGTQQELEGLREEFPELRLFRHAANRGKGASLRTAFAEARGDVWLIQDADLEYSPEDYPRLLRPIIEGKAHVVYGSRFTGGSYVRVHLFSHYLGNRILTLWSNLLTGLNLTDMETCYKAMRREVAARISIRSDGFNVEPELTAKIARMRARIFEVPISYAGRDFSEGKKISWRHGLAALWAVLRFRLAD